MSTLSSPMIPVARMTQEQVDKLFVDTRYLCEALGMQQSGVNNLMARRGKRCLRLAGKLAWYREDADEVIAKVKAEREENIKAGLPNGWK